MGFRGLVIFLLVGHQLRVGELAAKVFITGFDLFQAIQHGKVPFRAPGARSTFVFGAKQEKRSRRGAPLGKSVPERNRIGDAMNHLSDFIRFGRRCISMGT